MLKIRFKALSVLLARVALVTTPALIMSLCEFPSATGVLTSRAHAQTAAKSEKITATVALPGVQVESLNPYAHSTTQIYPTWKHGRGAKLCRNGKDGHIDILFNLEHARIGFAGEDFTRFRMNRIDLALVAAVDEIFHDRVADLSVL